MRTSLQAIAQKAASQKKYRFRNLFSLLDEELLRECWRDIRRDAAYGVDRVSALEYEQNLEANIHDLVERLKRKSYRAKLIRRHYIPKADGKLRPLGIPIVRSHCTSYNRVTDFFFLRGRVVCITTLPPYFQSTVD